MGYVEHVKSRMRKSNESVFDILREGILYKLREKYPNVHLAHTRTQHKGCGGYIYAIVRHSEGTMGDDILGYWCDKCHKVFHTLSELMNEV